jgi:transcriptional regulator with XRE-family HTH domain
MEREKLIAARLRKYWTQPQAAEAVGCDVTALNRWEKDKATPHAYHRQKLCDVYGCTAQELGLERETKETSDAQSSPELQSMIGMDLTMRLMCIIFLPHRNYKIKQDEITRLIQEDTRMNNNALTRREALRRVATLPLMSLGLGTNAPVQHAPEEVINQCATGITSCWYLSKGSDESDLRLAFKGASAYLPALTQVMHDSAKYRMDAASLAGQSALLKTVLGWNLDSMRAAASYAQEAATYAQEAGDIALRITALDFLAWIYYYGNQYAQAEHATGQAMLLMKQYASSLSPLLRSRVYGTRALVQAKNGQSDSGLLGRASEHFFAGLEAPDLLYLDYDEASLIQADAMARYHGGDQKNAMASFGRMIDTQTLAAKIPQSERTRVETLNVMAMSSLKRPNKDLEETTHYWKAAIQGARTLQSELRFNEALTAYQVIDALWPGESRVRELRDLAVHW